MPEAAMDHETIAAEDVAERYVTGRLSEEEAARFEQHFMDCRDCAERVEAAERLQRGLAAVAAEEAATAAAVQAGLLGALLRLARSRRAMALAVAGLVALALLPAGLALRQAARLRGELERTRAALETVGAEGAQAGAGQAGALERELESADRRLAAREGQLTAELSAERGRSGDLARQLEAERRPRVNLPMVALTAFRAGEEGPVHTVPLPAEPGWIALWIEPGGDEFPRYRATLTRAGGAVAWRGEDLVLNELGAAVVAFYSASLAPGDYELVLEGLRPPGEPVPLSRFRLRVEAGG